MLGHVVSCWSVSEHLRVVSMGSAFALLCPAAWSGPPTPHPSPLHLAYGFQFSWPHSCYAGLRAGMQIPGWDPLFHTKFPPFPISLAPDGPPSCQLLSHPRTWISTNF